MLIFTANKRLDLRIVVSKNIIECDPDVVLDLIVIIGFRRYLNTYQKRLTFIRANTC